MRKLLPQTLFGQTLAVLLAGIGLALAAGAYIYSSARQEAVRAVGALTAAERIVNISRLVGETPLAGRQRLIEGSSDQLFRVALVTVAPRPLTDRTAEEDAAVIADYIRQSLAGRTVIVTLAEGTGERMTHFGGPRGTGPHMGPGQGWGRGQEPGKGAGHGNSERGYGGRGYGPMGMGPPLSRAAMSWRGLDAAIEIETGQWLRFTTSLPDTGPSISLRLILALAVMAAMIAALTAWAARRVTQPLAMLSDAALRIGNDVNAPPLAATGSREIRRAAEAFNEMQTRLRLLIENRTLMLAAISHDVRTELMLLRLRTESLPTSDDRERMLKTIADMEAMLTATLSFARDEATSEQRRRVDLSALVSSVVDDMADAGLAVAAGDIPDGVIVDCKPVALRRTITNLLDNAAKYGGKATLSLMPSPTDIAITVEDEGPGIPEDQLERVLQPFYRVESSRSRATGGIGLGLAIAASIAEAHGGSLTLTNRKPRGLQARLILPR